MSTPEEQALGEAIMSLVAGADTNDAARALTICLTLGISHTFHAEDQTLADAEEALDGAFALAREVLHRSWGKTETILSN